MDIRANVTTNLLGFLTAQGATVESSFPQYFTVRANIPLAALETIAANADVRFIRVAEIPVANVGTATAEGFYAETVDTAQSDYGVTGAGVKVGVLSDSSRFLGNSQTAGDLGSVTVLPGQSGLTGFDEGEGTAMLEIVHDLAPGAQLFFATGFGGEPSMATNIIALANAGCNIIIDDVTYNDESPFHANQPITQAVKSVSDRGVLYFSSAANSGNAQHGTSGTWTGNFTVYGTDPNLGQLHDWGGTPFNQITRQNGGVTLFWSDPWTGSTNDYDLFITDVNGNILRTDMNQSGFDTNDIFGEPYETVAPSTNSGEYVVVALASGAQRDIWVGTGRGRLAHATAGNTRGHNAAPATNAFCVAAVNAQGIGSGYRFAGGTNNPVETFSSDGAPRLFFESDGSAVTPNNFTASGGRVLSKPDFAAADGVTASTNTFGTNITFTPFYGTSAAAPHAGAIAALVKSYRPDLTPAQIRQVLMSTTLDIETSGFDIDSGAGILMAHTAISNLNPTVSFFYPTNGQIISDASAPQILGFADSGTANLSSVRVALSRKTDGVWYDFVSGNWGTTNFNLSRNAFNASGLTASQHTSWLGQLPALADGTYTVEAQSVDAFSHVSQWNPEAFTLIAPPVVTFSPLTNTATVFDFSQLGGTVNQAGTVVFRIDQYDTSGNNDLFWNGSAWITNGNSPTVYLAAKITDGIWSPANGVNLPTRGQTRAGQYLLRAIATNLAGASATNDIFVGRSAQDTTPPILTLNNIHNGYVFTNPALPGLSGSALDYETGVASVTVYFNRFTGSGVLYWNGTSWSSTPAVLQANYNAQTVAWQVTNNLPSGANLPNAGYQVEIDAANNEVPAGNSSLFVSFSVDYHPVYTFTAGSYYDSDPYNDNMRWDNPANWDTGSLPTPDARVVINNYSPDNTSLGSVQLYRLDLSGGTLTTSGMLIQKLFLSGGALSGGVITLATNGVFNWSGGIISGTVTVPSGASLNLSGDADKTVSPGTLLTLNGNTIWTGAGNLFAGYGVDIENSGTFSIQNVAQFYNYTGGSPLPIFNNTGILQKTNSNGTATISPADGGWYFSNSGTLDMENGVLSSQSGLYLNNGTVFTGAAELRVDAGYALLTGTNKLLSGASFEMAGGTLDGTNYFAGPGTFIWSGGTVVGANTILSNANFSISGGSAKVLNTGGALTNYGNCVWTGAGPVYVSYGSIFENDGGFSAQSDAQFYNYTGSTPLPLFINNGSFIKTNSAGTTDFNNGNGGVAFNNRGSVNVSGGNLTLGGGGAALNNSFTAAAGSVIDFYGGAFFFNGNLSLAGAGTNRVNGATVTFNNGTNTLSGANTFEIASGAVNGTNTFAGAGTLNWSGGFISAALNLQSNIAFNLSTVNVKTLSAGGALTVAGNSLWSGGDVYVSYASSIINNGIFSVQSDAQFYNYTGSSPVPVFVNNGSFIKSGVAATTTFNPANGGVAFNHNGTINVAAGDLVLGGGGSGVNGIFTAASGSHIDLTGGSFTASGGTTISGAGVTRVNGANLTFGGGSTALSGNFEVAAGSVAGTNLFTGDGIFNWTGGSIAGNFTLQTNVAFNISGSADKALVQNGTLTIAGNSTWSGAGNLFMSYASAINSSGTFAIQNDSQFYNYTGSSPLPVFNNSGTFRKTGGTNSTTFAGANGGVSFNNTGIVDLRAGTLGIGAGYFTAPTEQLKISLGGLSAGAQFGTEAFTGAATFAGTLGITLANGFTPTNGNSFVLATFPSSAGQFSATQFPALPVGSQWKLTYAANSLLLQVVPSNVFQSAALTNGNFQFTFVGVAGSSCFVEVSTNLANWLPLFTNTPFNGTLNFVDLHTAQFKKRFYSATIFP